MIRLQHVGKTYPEGEREHRVLDGVDLHVPAGRRLALLGPSGCGKSTLLNLIAGLDLPSTGRILVNGVDLTSLGEPARTRLRRERIGIIFQFFNLVPTLTVLENVLLPLELAGTLNRSSKTRAVELLERVGMADRGSSFPDVLSGGQQQRVAVARALVHQPAIVLADEPTGNLDESSAERVLELLRSVVRDAGVTLVMATHSRAAAAIADHTLSIRDGGLASASENTDADPTTDPEHPV